MIPKGIGDIRSVQTINTRPGPLTEKGLLLKLYKLASQKANFQKKKEWAGRQRLQSIRHLADIQREIRKLKKFAMEKIGSSPSKENLRTVRRGTRKKWSEVSLKY